MYNSVPINYLFTQAIMKNILNYLIAFTLLLVTASKAASLPESVLVAVQSNYNVVKIWVSKDIGKTWMNKITVNEGGSVRHEASCTGYRKEMMCAVAAGSVDHKPAVAVSTDGGVSWEQKTVQGFPLKMGDLDSISCTGKGKNARCAAIGHAWSDPSFIVVSTDGGLNWVYKYASYINSLSQVSCTDSGAHAVCVAVGRNLHDAIVSNDGGDTWQEVTYAKNNPYEEGEFPVVSCTGTGSGTKCVVAIDYNHNGYKLVSVSDRSAMHWQAQNVSQPDTCCGFNGNHLISCTGTGSNAHCAITGNSNSIMVSTDGLQNWRAIDIGNEGFYGDISCAGTGTVSVCATTLDGFGSKKNSIVMSRDGGLNWYENTVENAEPNFWRAGMSCAGTGASDSICVTTIESSSLAVSRNGGKTWQVSQIPPLDNNSRIVGLSAAGGI